MTTLFVDVLLPLALPGFYTYRVPRELNNSVKEGKRVAVQFGKSRIYSALIRKIHETAPSDYQAKYILSVIDDEPVVNQQQFELWEWMAGYYLCTPGEVMAAALPAAFKLQSETVITLHPEVLSRAEVLSDQEYQLAGLFGKKKTLPVSEAVKLLGQKPAWNTVRSLIDKGIVSVSEKLEQEIRPRKAQYVMPAIEDDEALKEIFDRLEKRAPRQLRLLMALLSVPGEKKELQKEELLKMTGVDAAILKQLVKKGILKTEERDLWTADTDVSDKAALNGAQQKAFEEVKDGFGKKDIVLLHGVTSSGKTEIYIHLIEEVLREGKQVLYLLPEIALTTQIIGRLQRHFGNRAGAYHSRLNDRQRMELWQNVGREEGVKVVLGARSSLFLPFKNLGLIIVDEEHDPSFKQFDPSPRYNARDSAIYLSKLHQARVLLGSATPSLESYYNAAHNKFGLVKLTERFGGMELPEIMVVDIREEMKRRLMKSHFSSVMLDAVKHALQNREQVILFRNRRGFSSFMECTSCAWVPRCINCDVSLTYHKQSDRLRCHYCGHTRKLPQACEACGDVHLKTVGFGTEKIEEELSIYFPEARIARLDWDTTRTRNAFGELITSFGAGEIDILVGTQMVTKGLDFDNVSTVGILNADSMINFPDFRAFERSYQLMAQVSGRSGRKNKRGRVIIQTCNPVQPAIHFVVHHDYEGMYFHEMNDRKKFRYPPVHRLIQVTLKHRQLETVLKASAFMADQLRQTIGGDKVLGPETPLVPRIRNMYLQDILIKLDRNMDLEKNKEKIKVVMLVVKTDKRFKSVVLAPDVDPM